MFSGGMDVVLEYRTGPTVIDDSLAKRTMKVVDLRFLIRGESAVDDGVQT